MILLIRFILITLIIYLIFRSFVRYNQAEDEVQHNSAPENKNVKGKKISREIGEYIDFEEVDKKQ
jgi:large-conductance mechanosensitive channel